MGNLGPFDIRRTTHFVISRFFGFMGPTRQPTHKTVRNYAETEAFEAEFVQLNDTVSKSIRLFLSAWHLVIVAYDRRTTLAPHDF